jgi:DNA repair protein RadC
MTIETLFGKEEVPAVKPRTIRIKTIKAVFQTMTVQDHVTDYLKPNTRYSSPIQIFETFGFMRHETKEYFLALHLDGKNRVLCIDMVSTGSLNQSIVHPRELFKTALLSSAAAVILIHNHPTGDPTPSTEDITITRRLMDAGDMIGIKVLDHIIIGDSYYSFSERGII